VNKVIKFGIASVAVQRARSLAIAAGTRQSVKDEPSVWFPTVAAMARVLSDENMALLKLIRESPPDSMDSLAKAAGKHAPNVSRSLHTMAQYGLVKLTKHGRTVIPQATSERVTVDFSWGS
jgi:predicted transcriptional regulator